MRSLQARLALIIGLCVTVLWAGAAVVTANQLRHEMNEVFDSALQETAQRILPLAVRDIVDREEEGIEQRIAPLRDHEEFFTYVVRDAQGRLLLTSHAADPAIFPEFDGMGFRQSQTHRFYQDAALQGSITIAVAEPLQHRAEIAREMQLGLGLPLLVVIPLSFVAIWVAVRLSFGPVRRLRTALASVNQPKRHVARLATLFRPLNPGPNRSKTGISNCLRTSDADPEGPPDHCRDRHRRRAPEQHPQRRPHRRRPARRRANRP